MDQNGSNYSNNIQMGDKNVLANNAKNSADYKKDGKHNVLHS